MIEFIVLRFSAISCRKYLTTKRKYMCLQPSIWFLSFIIYHINLTKGICGAILKNLLPQREYNETSATIQ